MERQISEKLHILSSSGEPFRDRVEAGLLLAQQLLNYKDQNAVVLGIPRGGMIVAKEIARELRAELDIVLAHKLRTPGELELAMGSVSERGDLYINQDVVTAMNVSSRYIQEEKAVQMREIERHAKMFRAIRPKIPLTGRITIVTDDGVATGATTHAAIKAVQAENPQKLILAVPVGSEEALMKLAEDVDELICLKAPWGLMGVGQVYLQFAPVDDEQVLNILKTYRKRETAK